MQHLLNEALCAALPVKRYDRTRIPLNIRQPTAGISSLVFTVPGQANDKRLKANLWLF